MKYNSKNSGHLRFEQVVAGALLKFRKLDILDLAIIMERLKKECFAVPSKQDYRFLIIDEYIKVLDNGEVFLRNGVDFERQVKNRLVTIGELFQSVAGVELCEFFDRLNIVEFRDAKNQMLIDGKASLLENGNVLLISDDMEDLNRFKKFGFRNVDHFPSVMRAQNYFEENPKKMSQYQVIVIGSHEVVDQFRNLRLANKIRRQKEEKKALVVDLCCQVLKDKELFFISMENRGSFKSWFMKEKNLNAIMDDIVLGAVATGAVDSIELVQEYSPIDMETCENDIMSFPERKKDLKILYLNSTEVRGEARDIANSLGLNVTFLPDDDSRFDKITDKLGDYDIIIGSSMYSKRIANVSTECSFQCRFTGRPLVLLATYSFESLPINSVDSELEDYILGSRITLDYAFGEVKGVGEWNRHEKFGVPILSTRSDDYVERYHQGELANIKAVLEVAVGIYDKKKCELGGGSFSDGAFRTPRDYDLSLIEEFKTEKERQAEALRPIVVIDEIKKMAVDYLKYRKMGLIEGPLSGITISESSTGYRVEIALQGIVLSALTLSKNELAGENLRVFYLQRVNSKKRLSAALNMGVYTKRFEAYSVPRRPNESEWAAIMGIHKKMMVTVEPSIEEAKYREFTGDKRISFKRTNEKAGQ